MRTGLLQPHLLLLLLLTLCAQADSKFADNVYARGSQSNSFIKFTTQRTGTVAFIGGSITEMKGYRPMVSDWLTRRFPDTRFTFVDAGISSTCSTTGAFRLATDVFGKGPVDLLIVEFAVNDDQDAGHTREACIRGLEGIIRHARALNPDIDIVVTYFVNEGMLKTLQEGKMPLTMEAHEAVCAHYDVPTILLAREVARQITAGTLTWKQYGGVHPAPHGNAITAAMIEDLLTRAWAAPPSGKPVPHRMPEKPLDPHNYQRGRFIDPKEANVAGGWTLGVPDWKSLPGGKRERFTSIPILHAATAGSRLTLQFEGTAIGAYVLAGPDAGMLNAAIDGKPVPAVDLYHRFSKGLHYPRTVMFAVDLPPGKHTLELTVSDQSSTQGHAARIMQFVAN